MFTGIIERLGIIKKIVHHANLIVLTIDVGPLAGKLKIGDSVSINGVCLTATSKKGRLVSFDLMKETLNATTLSHFKVGDGVNLELALKHGDRLGGHFVTGHVDAVGIIKTITRKPNWFVYTIEVPAPWRRYVVPKGSIAIDGISLTIGKVKPTGCEVYLIPFTLKVTNLGKKKAGDSVNLETDLLAKYFISACR